MKEWVSEQMMITRFDAKNLKYLLHILFINLQFKYFTITKGYKMIAIFNQIPLIFLEFKLFQTFFSDFFPPCLFFRCFSIFQQFGVFFSLIFCVHVREINVSRQRYEEEKRNLFQKFFREPNVLKFEVELMSIDWLSAFCLTQKEKRKIYMRKKFRCLKFTKGFFDMLKQAQAFYSPQHYYSTREDLVLQLILWFMVSCFSTWILIYFLTYLLVSFWNLSLSSFLLRIFCSLLGPRPSSSLKWCIRAREREEKKLNFQNKLGWSLIFNLFVILLIFDLMSPVSWSPITMASSDRSTKHPYRIR